VVRPRGPLVTRLTHADGPWTEAFDPARVRGGAATAPVEVALVALAREALARRLPPGVRRSR
jgi:hypothetical protein